MTAPAEETTEQSVDCTDQLGHWMHDPCNGIGPGEEPRFGAVYQAYCGVRKVYEGPAWHRMPCAVCVDLKGKPCDRCGR